MGKVIYIIRNNLCDYPPCMTQIYMLNDLGIDVVVLCGNCSESLQADFNRRGITCIVFGMKRINLNRILGKISSYIYYRIKCVNLIKKYYGTEDTLWFATADSAIGMIGVLKNRKYVLNILELYDTYPFYKKGLSFLVNGAKGIIVCEKTRALIMKLWWSLSKMPFVMPNKPYFHPRNKNIDATADITKEKINQVKGKKIILYQGMISADRDLKIIATALNEMNDEYTLVLMGKEFYNGVSQIKEIYPQTVYLGYVTAPLHLEITSYAHIGVANYNATNLNNIFCAPNKIFEYTGFGIPVLCNDIPGLVDTIGSSGAGVCSDFENKESVKNAIRTIDMYYETFSNNANKFYDSIDNMKSFSEITREIILGAD